MASGLLSGRSTNRRGLRARRRDRGERVGQLGTYVIYLEERNRLLREKVRSQGATIEEQAARIDELRGELETARSVVAEREQPDASRSNPSSPWLRLKGWLQGS